MSLTLVNGGKPRRLSGPEIQALVAERVAARKQRYAEEAERRASERNYAERLAFYGQKRGGWVTVACLGALGVATGLAWLVTTEALAALGLTLSLSLMGVATYLSTRGE